MDWKEKLEAQYRAKGEHDKAEAQRRQNHDNFISSHGMTAWQELRQKMQDGSQHLTAQADARLDLVNESDLAFYIAGGSARLDVSLDRDTRIVRWSLRGKTEGMLKPDRQENELVYRDNGNMVGRVEDAAMFLLAKVF